MNKYWACLLRPLVRGTLYVLDKLFVITRTRVPPQYALNAQGQIELPKPVQDSLYKIALHQGKPRAVKRVATLTGSGLRQSKDYVDALLEKRGVGKKAM